MEELKAPALLTASHDLTEFNSGITSLDKWLRQRARANQVSGASRTYVIRTQKNCVIGYYALASGALAHIEALGRLKRNMPDPIPVAVLGRLALDRSVQGKGLGAALLRDAVLRVQKAASIMGIRGLLVHALSENARSFYEHYGFTVSITNPLMLILPIMIEP